MRDTSRTTGWLGALKTFFLLLFWPPGIAARRERIPWTLALGAHALAGAMVFGLLYPALSHPADSLADAIREIATNIFVVALASSPLDLLAAVGHIAARVTAMEVGVLLTGLAFSLFGARDEKLRWSYWRGVKVAWLTSPHVAMVFAGILFFVAAGRTNGNASMLLEMIHVGMVMVTLQVWFPAVLLLTVSAWSCGARCRWPGVCRDCGYPLVGVPAGAAHCPECGLSIDESLRPAKPIGGPLERVEDGWWLIRWLRGVAGMAWAPRQFGRGLQLFPPRRRYRGAMLSGIALLTLGGLIPWFLTTVSLNGAGGEAMMYPVMFAAFFAWGITAGMLAAAWLVGSVASLMRRRNLLAASAQAVSYLMPLLAFWALVVIVIFWCLAEWRILDGIHWRWLRANLSLEVSDLLLIAVVIATVLLAGLILSSLIRVPWAARHNNE